MIQEEEVIYLTLLITRIVILNLIFQYLLDIEPVSNNDCSVQVNVIELEMNPTK